VVVRDATLFVDGSGNAIDPADHLVVFLESALVAVPFDWKRLRVTGKAVPVFLSADPTHGGP
jgi:hypothetical protein